MFFLYLKENGEIIIPIRQGEPDDKTIKKETNCGIGSGVKWDNVDLFYASDEEFDDPRDFIKWAPQGKYYIENNEIKENPGWQEPEKIKRPEEG